jgi:hypothetical protein
MACGPCRPAPGRGTARPVLAIFSSIAYDSHGNTTTLGAETLRYDGADRHTETEVTPS